MAGCIKCIVQPRYILVFCFYPDCQVNHTNMKGKSAVRQKDMTQKTLEGFPDVFADIINALLYQGKPVLQEENLVPYATESFFSVKKHKIQNQFQDVSMAEQRDKIILAQYTIENQSRTDYRMVLRSAGYEGASYRRAYTLKKPYPYIGIILNWGTRMWKGKTGIHEYFSSNRLSKQMLKYINNLRYPVFNMRHLPPEVRKHFHSDMRIVVDYLADPEHYTPTDQKITHFDELMHLMYALTNDKNYEDFINLFDNEEKAKGGITMCPMLDRYWKDGVATGEARGMAQGRTDTLISTMKVLMSKLNLTVIQAMDMIDVADNDRPVILDYFKQGM